MTAIYQPSRDQRSLADSFIDSLAPLLPVERLHRGADEDSATWAALDALGLFDMGVSEDAGGLGLGAAEEALVVTALGRCLASPSLFATLGAAHARYAQSRPRRVFAAFDDVAADCPIGSPVLLRDSESAGVFVTASVGAAQDATHWLSVLAPVETGPQLGSFDAAGLLRLRLIEAAALAGLADGACALAVGYAQVREQFGRAIGSYQAVKHFCANMAIAAQSAGDLVTFAAVAVDNRRADAGAQVEAAWIAAAQAALANAATNIQIHGGIGFSDEADPHLFIKRARLLVAAGGGIEKALERIANRDALPAAI
jgi:alkylation response protein AidB-like acyl-CoA dehydrogenase